MATDFVDRICDRLDNPENVPARLAHLIPDDIQRVKRILDFPVSGRVLDVGCSDGSITRRIVEKWGIFAIGADVRASDGGGVREYFVPWDVREPYPYAAVLFDAIYCCEVFEHLTDADAVKARANTLAVLKPGGDFIVTVPNRHPADVYEVGCRSRWAWPDHRSAWTAIKLLHFLADAFTSLEWVSLYEHESVEDSIWLIVRAKGKR